MTELGPSEQCMVLKVLELGSSGHFKKLLYVTLFFFVCYYAFIVLDVIQGVPRHWTPGNSAKSQALYEIRHLENFQVSSSYL